MAGGVSFGAAALCAAGLLLAACGGSASPAGPGATVTSPPAISITVPTPPPLEWAPCGKAECAVLVVPRDYADPSRGTFELAVARRRAGDPSRRVGVLLFNPGGPGLPGTPIVKAGADLSDGLPGTFDDVVWDGLPGSVMMKAGADQFSEALLERFDVVSWDPRGTSRGSRIDCVDDPDFFRGADLTPGDRAEREDLELRIASFLAGCRERSGDLLPYVGSVATARDIDLLRSALGEDQISYLGISYGAGLGALYATMFPSRVRAMVLDAGYDLSAPPEGLSLQAAATRERVLRAIFSGCAADPLCYFHNSGDPQRAFDRLMARLEVAPLRVGPIRTPVDEAEAWRAVLFALLDDRRWTRLVMALGEAQDGDGMELLLLSEEFGLPGLPDPDAQAAIRCLDWPSRAGSVWGDAPATEMAALYPGAPAMAARSLCGLWPVAPQAVPDVTGRGAGRILVVAARGDAVVPYEASRQLADALEGGILLSVAGNRHGSYQPWRADGACVTEVVDHYLIELAVVREGDACGPGFG